MEQIVNIIPNNQDEEYIIFFINKKSNQVIFLGNCADIDAICYSSVPSLLGTLDYRLAKKYKTVEQAKDDIYKLRYHHREFLKIIIGIKKIFSNNLQSDNLLVSNISTYRLGDLT